MFLTNPSKSGLQSDVSLMNEGPRSGWFPNVKRRKRIFAYSPSAASSIQTEADIITLPTVAAGPTSSPLPPTVEEAYRRKCIDLRKRMDEVEQSNDAFRARKARLNRGIRKMRLERAYLLEMLGKRMKKNGGSVDGLPVYDEDSDGSSEGPPTVCPQSGQGAGTPNGRPLRSKRSHRRAAYQSSPPPGEYYMGQQQPFQPSQYHHHHNHPQHESPYGPVPGQTLNGFQHPANYSQAELLAMQQQQILAHQNQLPSQPYPQHPQAMSSHVPAADPFYMFFENNYLSQPHKHSGTRTEEDLYKLAREHWASSEEKYVKQRRMYEREAEKQTQGHARMAQEHQQQQAQLDQQEPPIQPKVEADDADDSRKGHPAERGGEGAEEGGQDVEMANAEAPTEAGGFKAINE